MRHGGRGRSHRGKRRKGEMKEEWGEEEGEEEVVDGVEGEEDEIETTVVSFDCYGAM